MSSMIPQYSTNIFTDIYPDVTTFVTDYKNNGIEELITDLKKYLDF